MTRALEEAGLPGTPRELGDTRMAIQAARAVGVELDQIVKSMIFIGSRTRRTHLFLTAGGRRVDQDKAEAVVGEPLLRADATAVRERTGFAIGGVSPVGLTGEATVWIDPRVMEFDEVWAAAGTPRHVFPVAPGDLVRMTGAAEADFAV